MENLALMASRRSWKSEKLTIVDKVDVILTNVQSGTDGTSNNAHKLLVTDSVTKEPVGSWTPIYDEGIDVRIGNRKFFAFSAYSCVDETDDKAASFSHG